MFDTARFLRENFKSGGGLIAFLRAYNAPDVPKEAAAEKWFQRGSVPGDWLALLIGYLEIDRGVPGIACKYLGATK
jgi:hypothetical protein